MHSDGEEEVDSDDDNAALCVADITSSVADAHALEGDASALIEMLCDCRAEALCDAHIEGDEGGVNDPAVVVPTAEDSVGGADMDADPSRDSECDGGCAPSGTCEGASCEAPGDTMLLSAALTECDALAGTLLDVDVEALTLGDALGESLAVCETDGVGDCDRLGESLADGDAEVEKEADLDALVEERTPSSSDVVAGVALLNAVGSVRVAEGERDLERAAVSDRAPVATVRVDDRAVERVSDTVKVLKAVTRVREGVMVVDGKPVGERDDRTVMRVREGEDVADGEPDDDNDLRTVMRVREGETVKDGELEVHIEALDVRVTDGEPDGDDVLRTVTTVKEGALDARGDLVVDLDSKPVIKVREGETVTDGEPEAHVEALGECDPDIEPEGEGVRSTVTTVGVNVPDTLEEQRTVMTVGVA